MKSDPGNLTFKIVTISHFNQLKSHRPLLFASNKHFICWQQRKSFFFSFCIERVHITDYCLFENQKGNKTERAKKTKIRKLDSCGQFQQKVRKTIFEINTHTHRPFFGGFFVWLMRWNVKKNVKSFWLTRNQYVKIKWYWNTKQQPNKKWENKQKKVINEKIYNEVAISIKKYLFFFFAYFKCNH